MFRHVRKTILLASLLSLSAALRARAEVDHHVFPVPGHDAYTQSLRAHAFTLNQREKRAFAYSCRAKCAGMDPSTPPSHSNFGVEICVNYTDGTSKWTKPKAIPQPTDPDWQEIADVFRPVRAVSNVVVYTRLARKGEAWFADVKVEELAPAQPRGPCRLLERDGLFLLENDFVRLTVDPSRGATAASCLTKSNGVDRAESGALFADAFEGCGANTDRVYRIIRKRDTPGAVELSCALMGPAGHPFIEIEKTFRLSRYEDGVEVVRRYRNLPAAMSDARLLPTGEEPVAIPLGGTAERSRVWFGAARTTGNVRNVVQSEYPFELELSGELVTPHTPWLRPYAGGRTKALFILDIRQQREIVELAQRMDLDVRTVRIASVFENMSYGLLEDFATYNFSDMNRDLKARLDEGGYDAVVMAGDLWERLDEANRGTIRKMLAAGVGLVVVQKRTGVLDGYEVLPKGLAYVKGGLPETLLPFDAGRVTTLASGNSRAVFFDYNASDGLTPFVRWDLPEPGFFYADYALALMAKGVLWAARKDLSVPPEAKAEESFEDSGDGLLIRRKVFRTAKGAYDFACTVEKGESSAAAKARLAQREKDLAYPTERPSWPDFSFSVGAGSHRNGIKRYLVPLRFAQLEKIGVNHLRFWAIDPPQFYRPYLRYGMGMGFPICWGQLRGNRFQKEFQEPYAKTHDKKYLCRKPCLNDPEYLSADRAKTAADIDAVACLKPVNYDCNDENSLTRWIAPFDFCFGEHCLAAFRRWLKTQYDGLAALNAAWGTDFATWDEVVPDTTEEARSRARRTGRAAYGAWADHRTFMEITYADYFDGARRVMVEKEGELPFDMSGTQPPNGWTGMDMWRMAKVIDFPAVYDTENVGEIIRSFGRPLVHPWYGYRLSGPYGAYRVWYDAFRYLNFGISFYSGINILRPDYTIPPQVRQLTDALADLRAGGARLLRTLDHDVETLIHYSQPSIHAAQIEDRYADFLAARDTWCRRLVASGRQFRFVASAELEDGALDCTRASAVILPHSAALSDGEVRALTRFAARGGVIVGDRLTGTMDEHCRARTGNPLAGTMRTSFDFGPESRDGVRVFRYRSREGLVGTYYGFARELDAKGGFAATRRVDFPHPSVVYDLREHRCLGRVSSFETHLAPGAATFYAVLPYEVKSLSVGADFSLTLSSKDGSPSGFHPVKVEVFDADGTRIHSDMTETRSGRGRWRPSLPRDIGARPRQVVFTDFISNLSCVRTIDGQDL